MRSKLISSYLPAFASAILATTLLVPTSSSAQVLDKDQQKCLNTLNKEASKIAKTQGKSNRACLKAVISGKTESLGNGGQTQTAQACLTNDVKGKGAKAQAKLAAADADKCAVPPPFGHTGEAVTGASSTDEVVGMVADIFGPDLDVATTGYADEAGPACQQDIYKEAQRLYDTLWKTALKGKKDGLKGKTGPAAASSGELQVAMFAPIGADTKGKIQKAVDKLTGAAEDDCALTTDTPLDLFPGNCGGEATFVDFANCAATAIKCRFCQNAVTVDGLANGCDGFDDGVGNASCSGGAGSSASQITDPGDLISGPLADGQVGDWLLENDVARFIIQDVAQRDMYSVGAFGGNIIDAELIANPGNDNFLEIQPALNLETVLNAQTIELINDGSNGAPAILRVCGPDDILDFVNASTVIEDFGLPFPASANDADYDIEACTTYSLAAGQAHLQVVTTVFNNSTEDLPLFLGDYINAAGELELWGSSNAGIGERLTATLGVLSYIGYGEASGVDYSHVTIPNLDIGTESSFFAVSGVSHVLHSMSTVAAILGTEPVFVVPAEGSQSYERYFGVGDGSGGNAVDLENLVKAVPSGTIDGCVTVGGVPAPGARVSAGPEDMGSITNLSSNWTTDASGCYSGTLPVGSYGVAGWAEGVPFEGGGASPMIHTVAITDGGTVTQNIALPVTGRLHVDVTDETLSAIPARVSVVGFDPSPEFIFTVGVLGPETTGLFRDQNDVVPFGMTRAVYTDAAGVAEFDVEPGSYEVYVSRGSEYSLYQTSVTITAGATTNVAAEIARVIDTTGFVSSDFHVHGIASADSRVSHSDRVRQFAGEGIDNVVMTDHHAHTDLDPSIASLGFSSFLASTIGEEITTWDTGHFNAYPMTVDPTRPSGGSTDWGVAAPAGMDFPSAGHYVANPDEIEMLALTSPQATPDTVVQINHIDSHFVPLQIDTSAVPPVSNIDAAGKTAFRLDPSTGNLYHHYEALELWNGDNLSHQSQFLDERIGIWFNLLNQGLLTTAIADTDTHRFQNLNSAGARSWTSSSTDAPASISDSEIAAAVSAGRVVGGQGPYVQTRLIANEDPLLVADLTLTGSNLVSITDAVAGVDLEITVQSPLWAEFDTIEIYANASTAPSPTSVAPELFTAVPTLTLTAGIDFTISTVVVAPGVTGGDRLETMFSVPFTSLPGDTWFVVVVKGTDGTSRPMFPVFPADLDTGSNTTLADLVDGNLGELGMTALGFTNALYVDADGTPGFQAPLAP